MFVFAQMKVQTKLKVLSCRMITYLVVCFVICMPTIYSNLLYVQVIKFRKVIINTFLRQFWEDDHTFAHILEKVVHFYNMHSNIEHILNGNTKSSIMTVYSSTLNELKATNNAWNAYRHVKSHLEDVYDTCTDAELNNLIHNVENIGKCTGKPHTRFNRTLRPETN